MSLTEDYNAKLQQVLQLFLVPDYNVVTTTYLDLLLTHMINEINKGKLLCMCFLMNSNSLSQPILNPACKINCAVIEFYFNNLSYSAGNQTFLQNTQNWIITAFNTWNENLKPCQSVSIFTIKLIGMMSLKETTFLNLLQNKVHDKACLVFQFQTNNLPASVKMAFATMFLNLLEHNSGRQWIAKTGILFSSLVMDFLCTSY